MGSAENAQLESAIPADDDASRVAAQLRAEIEQTRAGMSETIDALQEKLSPDHIIQQVKDKVQEEAEETKQAVKQATLGKAEQIMETVNETVGFATRRIRTVLDDSGILRVIRNNPVPFVLLCAGIGLLVIKLRSSGNSWSDEEDAQPSSPPSGLRGYGAMT